MERLKSLKMMSLRWHKISISNVAPVTVHALVLVLKGAD